MGKLKKKNSKDDGKLSCVRTFPLRMIVILEKGFIVLRSPLTFKEKVLINFTNVTANQPV